MSERIKPKEIMKVIDEIIETTANNLERCVKDGDFEYKVIDDLSIFRAKTLLAKYYLKLPKEYASLCLERFNSLDLAPHHYYNLVFSYKYNR